MHTRHWWGSPIRATGGEGDKNTLKTKSGTEAGTWCVGDFMPSDISAWLKVGYFLAQHIARLLWAGSGLERVRGEVSRVSRLGVLGGCSFCLALSK